MDSAPRLGNHLPQFKARRTRDTEADVVVAVVGIVVVTVRRAAVVGVVVPVAAAQHAVQVVIKAKPRAL